MMLPILISVSVAPVSYLFCASAPLLDAASTANAAETIAILFMVTGITVSLVPLTLMARVMAFLNEKLLVTLAPDYHFAGALTTKSPPRNARRAASLVVS